MSVSKTSYLAAGLAIPLVIAIWWAASTQFSRVVLPSPPEVAAAFLQLASSGKIAFHVAHTLFRVGLAFCIGLALSMLLGFLTGRSPSARASLEMIVLFLQSIPSAIWIVLAIIWFGISSLSPIFVVWAIAFPILAVNILQGIRNVDQTLVEMAGIFGHSKESIFSNVVIPSIFPYILTGSRVAMSLAWKVSVIAEVLGAQSGIGYAISFAWERLRTDEIFAWAIVIVAVLQAFDQLVFRPLERRVRRYQPA